MKNILKLIKEFSFLRKFTKEYFAQDNSCTAYPTYFQIRDVGYENSYHFDDGDAFQVVTDGEIFDQFDTMAEVIECIFSGEFEDYQIVGDTDHIDMERPCYRDIDNAVDCFLQGCISVYSIKEAEVFKGMFLLRSEAEQHLKLNHYHYHSKATVWCSHAWRAPMTERFLEIFNKGPKR